MENKRIDLSKLEVGRLYIEGIEEKWGDKNIWLKELLLKAHPERGFGISPHYRNIHLLNKIRNEPVIRPLPPGLRLFGT